MNLKLIKGDCLEKMKDIQDKSIDMICCDLPYGTTECKWDVLLPLNDYIEIEIKNKIKQMNYEEYKYYCLLELKISDIKLINKQWNDNKKMGLWTEYNRIIKDNGAIVLFGDEPFTSNLIMSNIKNFRYKFTWDKVLSTGFLNAKRMPLKQTEDICVFYKKLPTYNPQMTDADKKNIRHNYKPYAIGDDEDNVYNKKIFIHNDETDKTKRFPTTLIKYSRRNKECHAGKLLHKTQKPVELLEYLIKTYTDEGQTILDNTMGSCSTGIACINTNRNFIGIELDDTYFETCKNRVKTHINEHNLQDIHIEIA